MAVRSFNIISLCSGVGGLDLGVQLARPDAVAVCHVEREAAAAAILVARMESGVLHPAPIWSDVATFDAGAWRGVVDCVISGDPCQPNSVAGKGLGPADDRWLLDRVIDVFDRSGARRFFRENVTGNAAGQLAVLIPALERLGCSIAVGIFSAESVGAGHLRERIFVMADRQGDDGRLQLQPRRSQQASAQFRGRGEAMAIASHFGHERSGSARRRRDGLAHGDGDMAHAASSSCGREGCLDQQPAWLARGSGSLPIFAPGPADPRWAGIIAEYPALAPAVERPVCRMVDGVAARVDQLRAIGNGVFPLAAAYAWRTLDARLAETAGDVAVRAAA